MPAGVEVVAELTIDQRLAWLGDGAWEWRFPTVVAPRYLRRGARDRCRARMVDVTEAPVFPRAIVTVLLRDALAQGRTCTLTVSPVFGRSRVGLWDD